MYEPMKPPNIALPADITATNDGLSTYELEPSFFNVISDLFVLDVKGEELSTSFASYAIVNTPVIDA
jgi:hypothetical protein